MGCPRRHAYAALWAACAFSFWNGSRQYFPGSENYGDYGDYGYGTTVTEPGDCARLAHVSDTVRNLTRNLYLIRSVFT